MLQWCIVAAARAWQRMDEGVWQLLSPSAERRITHTLVIERRTHPQVQEVLRFTHSTKYQELPAGARCRKYQLTSLYAPTFYFIKGCCICCWYLLHIPLVLVTFNFILMTAHCVDWKKSLIICSSNYLRACMLLVGPSACLSAEQVVLLQLLLSLSLNFSSPPSPSTLPCLLLTNIVHNTAPLHKYTLAIALCYQCGVRPRPSDKIYWIY